MSTYETLRAELRSVSKSSYIVNQKNERTFDREWSIYALFQDGTNHKIVTRDDETSRDHGIRQMIRLARQHPND